MTANGPAIWGGCVTRRKHRAESWYFSQKAVTVQGGYGAVFAVRVQVLLSITRVAVQAVSEPENYHGAGFILRASARVRVQEPLRSCLGCRSKSKNCDEQLTHIVRVRLSYYYLSTYKSESYFVVE
jgi:hypothetical protein